jgi:hypothetical protein
MVSDITVAITTFGREKTILDTVSDLTEIPILIYINDANRDLANRLLEKNLQTICSNEPQLFWQGITALVRNCSTEWLLITSDEDPVIVEEIPNLEKFASSKQAGVVACPVYDSQLVKPWPSSWVERMSDSNPLHPKHFHDISGYISGTLLHTETALKHISMIENLAPENDYVKIYTVPALVALMGMTRHAYTYPNSVTVKGPEMPLSQNVPGANYWELESRKRQKNDLEKFLKIICDIDLEYGKQLSQSNVYGQRGWV